jgi:hypothetical protein
MTDFTIPYGHEVNAYEDPIEGALNAWASLVISELSEDDNFTTFVEELFRADKGRTLQDLFEDEEATDEYYGFMNETMSNILARAIVMNRKFISRKDIQ